MAKPIFNESSRNLIILISLILIVLLVWGYVGGIEAGKVTITCDVGLGDNLCWKWHKNIIGQFAEALNDFSR